MTPAFPVIPVGEEEIILTAAMLLRRIQPRFDKDLRSRLAETMALLDAGPTAQSAIPESPHYNQHQQSQSENEAEDILPQAKRKRGRSRESSLSEDCGSDVDAEVDDDGPTSRSFNHISTHEYPNGNKDYYITMSKYTNLIEARRVGWQMGRYSRTTDGGTVSKICLGMYQCPVPHCDHVEKPRLSRSTSKNKPTPLPPKDAGECPTHKSTLVLVRCGATLKITSLGKRLFFQHRGFHDHAKPSAEESLKAKRRKRSRPSNTAHAIKASTTRLKQPKQRAQPTTVPK
ncbi:hypothetical protein CPB97_001036 [Podila verticillata]|nr:hypothetical protein CPB97_001036 [Podila verticillata]